MINIIGMWGVLDNKLVHPSTPNSEPVVLFYGLVGGPNGRYELQAYFISNEKISTCRGDCVGSTRSNIDPIYKNDINDYLNSEELIINRTMLPVGPTGMTGPTGPVCPKGAAGPVNMAGSIGPVGMTGPIFSGPLVLRVRGPP